MQTAFNENAIPKGAKVVMSPTNNDIIICANRYHASTVVDIVRAAGAFLRDPVFHDLKMKVSCDYNSGYTMEIRPEDKTARFSAVDVFVDLMTHRGTGESHMFNILQQTADKIQVCLKSDEKDHGWPNYEQIYDVALDAAMLSRKNNGKDVEFIFRDQKVSVNGWTHPEDVENLFPEGQRTNKDRPAASPMSSRSDNYYKNP